MVLLSESSCIHQHLPSIPDENRHTILSSVAEMIKALDDAIRTSSDTPDAPPITLGSRETTGSSGCPRVDISPGDLALLISGCRVTHEELARLYNCHPRTIRRRLLEYGLSQPGPPVYRDKTDEHGLTNRVY